MQPFSKCASVTRSRLHMRRIEKIGHKQNTELEVHLWLHKCVAESPEDESCC
jgi:hypothetical protein